MSVSVTPKEVLRLVRRGLVHTSGPPLRYEDVGPIDAPTIVVQGGITASCHVSANALDQEPGWWEPVVSAGGPLDPRHWRVLSVDPLGGPEAPCPSCLTRDQASVIATLLDQLGIRRVHAFIGASYGGMVGLSFAAEYPKRLQRLVAISAPDKPHPIATAARSLQRRVLDLGLRHGCESEAVSIARGLAMTTYRTESEFGARFDAAPASDGTFAVETYLQARGRALVGRMDAVSYIRLTQTLDHHFVDAGRINTPTTIVAVRSDRLVPLVQLEDLAACIPGQTQLEIIDSWFGHDAFLKEPVLIGHVLERVLAGRAA